LVRFSGLTPPGFSGRYNRTGGVLRRLRLFIAVVFQGLTVVLTGAKDQPNFSGVWKLANGTNPQFLIMDQRDTDLRVVQFIGDKPFTIRGPIDGQTHPQIVDRYSCDFLARLEGDSLFLDTKYEARDSKSPAEQIHIRSLMRLAADGWTMSERRTNISPQKRTSREKWQKQDSPPGEVFISGFDNRRKLQDLGADLSGTEGNRLRGLAASAFNNVSQAELELAGIADQQPGSRYRDEARQALAAVYGRNGMARKALEYDKSADHSYYSQATKHSGISVARRGNARVQLTRDPDGRIMLPVAVGGKESRFMVDTGTALSWLRRSEAERLGLKLESYHHSVGDGNVSYDGILAIVPDVTVGATRFENVPFLVVPDARCDWPGIVGMNLLLKLETLRWNAGSEGETGFPAQEMDVGKANLCFSEFLLLVEVGLKNKTKMVFFVDTGDNHTKLFPEFATRNLDLVIANGRLSVEPWHAQGASGEARVVNFGDITLSLGGADQTLQPPLLLEKPSVNDRLRGQYRNGRVEPCEERDLGFSGDAADPGIGSKLPAA
jgi:clan AA aspartic protease (TIGR02281 family)